MDFYLPKILKLSKEIGGMYALVSKLVKGDQIGESHEHPIDIQQILKEFEAR